MAQTAPVPPSGYVGPRSSRLISFAVIVTAVAGLLAGGLLVGTVASEEAKGDSSQLVIEMMARYSVGIDDLLGQDSAATQMGQYEQYATSPAAARTLAAVAAAVEADQGRGRSRAWEILRPHLLGRIETDQTGRLVHPIQGGTPIEMLPEQERLDTALCRIIFENDEPDAVSVQLIREKMGWTGDLLLSRDQPDSDALRSSVLQRARRTFLGVISFSLLVIAAGVVGLVLMIVAIVLLEGRRLSIRFSSPVSDSAIYLESFAVYMILMMAFQLGPALLGFAATWVGLAGLAMASIAGVAWAVIRGVPLSVMCYDLGLTRGEGVIKEIACGIVGYLAILPLLAGGIIATLVLILIYSAMTAASSDGSPPQMVTHPVMIWIADGGWAARFGVLFLAAVFAPFFEETMFRGALLRGLRRGPARFLGPALIMALIFAIIHPQGPLAVPVLGSLAFGFALLREWRGSLIAPMTAHALHNGTLVVVMILILG